MRPVESTDIITFGKHKHENRTFGWILANDPEYLCWLNISKPGYLSGEVLAGLNNWASNNMATARQVKERTEKAAGAYPGAYRSSDSYGRILDRDRTMPPAPTKPSPPEVVRPVGWGSW